MAIFHFSILGLILAIPAAAQEQCGEATVGKCFPEYSAIATLTAIDHGYAAIAARGIELSLLRIDASGLNVEASSLPRPRWLTSAADAPTINRLVAGPNGSALAVGWAAIGSSEDLRQVGVLGLIASNGSVTWSEPVSLDQEGATILHSATYDAAAKRFVIVGRVTNGNDSGTCEKWAQAIVFSVADTSATTVPATIKRFGSTSAGPHNRIALLDIVAGANPGEFVGVGFAADKAEEGAGCQDNAIAVKIKDAGGTWQISKPYVLSGSSAGEVANAVAPAGPRQYVYAGSGFDMAAKAKAAMVGTFGFGNEDSWIEMHPYRDRKDTRGGDRYRAVVPMRWPGKVLVAGSASFSKDGRNQGLWRVISIDQKPAGDAQYLTEDDGSDILAVARGRDGRILAAGTHGGGDDKIGWLGMVVDEQFAASRREPDKSLKLVSDSDVAAHSVAIGERDIASGTGFRQKGAKAGLAMDTHLNFTREVDLTASALPVGGNVDLALIDSQGKPIAQSMNLNDAGEYLHAHLTPGDYRLIALASTNVDEYEVRLSQASIEGEVLSELTALDPDTRTALSDELEGAGYGVAANPAITLGGDTVRALLAYFNTFQTDLEPGAINQFIADATAGPDGQN
ncbi:hypothetical protein X728_11500 [Mesorhizobium sp. L103C120A0]|nr:hypothetical protein X728_11500 [Mesorhizobium sp. L103C120A0]